MSQDPAHSSTNIATPSGAQAFSRCGHKYRLIRELGPRPSGPAGHRGAAVHQATTEGLHVKARDGILLNEDEFGQIAASTFNRNVADDGIWLNPKQIAEGKAVVVAKALDETVRLAQVAAREILPVTNVALIGEGEHKTEPFIERRVEIEAEDIFGKGFTFSGRLDWLTNECRVDDVKSGKTRNQRDIDLDDQLTGYAWLSWSYRLQCGENSITTVKVAWHNLKLLKKGNPYALLTSERTVHDFVLYQKKLRLMGQMLQKGIFPPALVGSWWCTPDWCEFWNDCEYVNHERIRAAEIAPES